MYKSEIRIHKSKTNPKSKIQNPKNRKFWFLVIGLLVIVCNLAPGALNFNSYAYAQGAKEEEALFIAKKAFEDGFYDVSLGLLERFLRNYPNTAKIQEVNLLIGRCYFQQGRFLDALNKFEELLNQPQAKNIKDAVIYWIAEVHFRGNNFSKSASYYKMIIDDFPVSAYAVSAYYSLGWCLFQERKFDEALRFFKATEEKFPKEPLAQDASFKIIECLYNLKDYSGIKERIKLYLKIYAKDPDKLYYLYFYLAEADYYLNNFQEAIDEYAKVIVNSRDEKTQGLSRLGTGWAFLKLKRYQEAENTFAGIKAETLEKASRDALYLGKAILMAETKRFDEAKGAYAALLATTEDPVVLIQAYIGRADAFYNLADYQEAIAVYKEAAQKISGSVPQEVADKLHYGLAWALLKEGEFKEAIDEFQKIAKHTEDKIIKVSVLCQIGDTYQDSGDYAKAAESYDVILKDYPDSLYSDYVQYQLGITLLKASKYDGAILAFQNLKAKFPDSKLLDDASYALGLSYFQREDYNASKEIFEKFTQEYKDGSLTPQATYLLGTSFYNLGKYAEAIEVFKNIIRMYGQDEELVQKAEYEIADCYYQLGNEQESLNRFKTLRSKYPDSKLTPEVIWWLGEYYYRRNELSIARRYFTSLIQDFPKSALTASSFYAVGSTYAEESNYQEAINNFQKVMELDKADLAGQAGVAMGDIYLKQEKPDLALGAYKDAVAEHANLDNLVYPKIADVYSKLGDYDQAIDFYEKGLAVVPLRQMSDIQFKIAEARQAKGALAEAIEDYLKATYLYADNNDLTVKALLRVAAIYENKENFKEALNIYKRIAAMNVEEAKYARERMDWIRVNIK